MQDFIQKLFNKIGLNKEGEETINLASAATEPTEEGEKKLSFFQKAYLVYDDIANCFYDQKRSTGAIVSFFVMIITIFCMVFTVIHNPLSVSTVFLVLMTICLDVGLFGLVIGRDIFTDEALNVRLFGKKIKPEYFWPFIVYFVFLLVLYSLIEFGIANFPFDQLPTTEVAGLRKQACLIALVAP